MIIRSKTLDTAHLNASWIVFQYRTDANITWLAEVVLELKDVIRNKFRKIFCWSSMLMWRSVQKVHNCKLQILMMMTGHKMGSRAW